jgi:thiol-disulfide isomerase/thioredoxin
MFGPQEREKKMKNKIGKLALAMGIGVATASGIFAQGAAYGKLGGGRADLAKDKGKVVVLAVGARWLPLTVGQAETLNKLSEKYAKRDVVFYFIAADSTSPRSKNYASDDDLRKFAADNRISAQVLRDPEGTISLKEFGVDQVPSFVIIDRAGAVSGEPFSGSDPTADVFGPMSRIIDRLLSK